MFNLLNFYYNGKASQKPVHKFVTNCAETFEKRWQTKDFSLVAKSFHSIPVQPGTKRKVNIISITDQTQLRQCK